MPIIEVLTTLIVAGAMSALPALIKWLVEFYERRATSTKIEVKGPSGHTETIELKKDMSPEDVNQLSEQLTKIIKSE